MTEPAIFEIERGKPLPEIPLGPTAIFVDDGMGDGPAAYDVDALLDCVDSVILVGDGIPLGPARVIETKSGKKIVGSPLQAHAVMIEQGRALLVTAALEVAALWSDAIERKGKTAVSLQFLQRHEGRLN
jgi:hypothetical protein